MAFGIKKNVTNVQFDKNGNRLVMGPGGKLIAAPKVKQPVAKPGIARPGDSTRTPDRGTPGIARATGAGPYTPNPNAFGPNRAAGINAGGQTMTTALPNPTGQSFPAGTGIGGAGTMPTPNQMAFQAASTGGAGGPLGTGGAVTGADTDLDKTWNGFARAFNPTMLNYIMANPEQILRQLMVEGGMNPEGRNSGLYTAVTPYTDSLMSILPLAFGGGGQPDASSPINWIASQLQQGMQPGGQGIDFTQVLNAMRSQLRDPHSAASDYYAAPGMDPIDQFNKAKETILGAASSSLAPQFQAAQKNALNSAYDAYMSQLLTSKNPQDVGNFLNYYLNSKNGYIGGY